MIVVIDIVVIDNVVIVVIDNVVIVVIDIVVAGSAARKALVFAFVHAAWPGRLAAMAAAGWRGGGDHDALRAHCSTR